MQDGQNDGRGYQELFDIMIDDKYKSVEMKIYFILAEELANNNYEIKNHYLII